MRIVGVVLVVLCELITAASGHLRQRDAEALPKAALDEWVDVLRKAYPLVHRPDDYRNALARALEFSEKHPRHRLSAKTSEYVAFGLYNQFRFSEATRAYVRTKRLALAARDPLTAAFASHALSNIYLSAGNVAGALEEAQEAAGTVPDSAPLEVRATFRTHHARLLARTGRVAAADRAFAEIIATAESHGYWGLLADAWKFAGHESQLRGELDAAERAVLRSLRVRLEHGHPELASDYHDLAAIQLRAGRPAEAMRLLESAVRHLATAKRFPAWRVYLLRGEARLAMDHSAAALADLRRAVHDIEASPIYALPGDLLRSQISRPTHAYELFAQAAVREFQGTGNRQLLDEAFSVSEAGRAAGLRASGGVPAMKPAEAAQFWRIVADLDEANARLLARNTDTNRRQVSRLRLALAELETGFDHIEGPVTPRPVSSYLSRLSPQEVLIGFQLGERSSLAWTLVAGSLAATELPNEATVRRLVREWMESAPGRPKLERAHTVFRVLFGSLPPAVHTAGTWLVEGDNELFRAPLGALVSHFRSDRPVYLVEEHSLQLVPGVWALERRVPSLRRGRFLGVGDPIYNQADSRTNAGWKWAVAAELPRLAGSGTEVETCARLWPSATTLIGARAVPEELSRQLAHAPAVVHLATHVVPAPDLPAENLLALGAGPRHAPAFLGPEWIGAHRLPGSLVVMTGCRSGSGSISASEGLMGLTRAWLRAGAGRVLSTYWPMLDDGGALVTEFYRQLLHHGNSSAEALRLAQVTMLRQGDWRADPKYWAAYFLIGYPE